jgi:uncharacterized protein
LRELIQLLERLQEIDTQIEQHEDELNRFPREAQEIARSVVALRREITEAKDKQATIEKDQKKREQDLAIEQEKIKKSEKRLLSIKNQKEHNALLREIKLGKKITGEIEDTLLNLMSDSESIKRILDRKESEYQVLEDELIQKKKQISDVSDYAKKHLEELGTERSELAEKVDRDYLKKYQTVKKARGNALAEVENGSCTGCHMILPPQLTIRVLKQEELIFCPNCQRILFIKPENIPAQNKI